MTREALEAVVPFIHQALDRCDGDLKGAAAMLEWSVNDLRDAIQSWPDLNTRWGGQSDNPLEDVHPGPISDEHVVGRNGIENHPTDMSMLPVSDVKLAEAMEREDNKLKAGLQKLGLTEKETKTALALQEFHGQQFRASIEIVGAGVTKLSIKYQTVLDELIDKRLRDVWDRLKALPQTGNVEVRAYLVEEERALLESLAAIGAETRRILEVANKGALTMAVIRQKYMKSGKASKPKFGAVPNA